MIRGPHRWQAEERLQRVGQTHLVKSIAQIELRDMELVGSDFEPRKRGRRGQLSPARLPSIKD